MFVDLIFSYVGLSGIVVTLSLIGLATGFYQKNQLFIAQSLVAILIFGLLFAGGLQVAFSRDNFLTQKAVLAQVYNRDFDRVCSQNGKVIVDGSASKNCYEIAGYRVWAIGDRFYVSVLSNDTQSIDVIFDRDELIAEYQRSIVYVAPDVNFRDLDSSLKAG